MAPPPSPVSTTPTPTPATAASAGAPADTALHEGVVFRQDVTVQHRDDTVLVTIGDRSGYRLRQVSRGIRDALYQLATAATPSQDLAEGLSPGEATQLDRLLQRLTPFLAHGLLYNGRELAALEATAEFPPPAPKDLPTDTDVRLSKFTLLRRRDDRLVLESPLCASRCVLKDPLAARLVSATAATATAEDLASQLAATAMPAEAVAELFGHLLGAGFLETRTGADPQAGFPSDDDEVLRQWDVHDLYFHSRSRIGRTDEPFGGRFPHQGRIEPQPPVKPAPEGDGIALHRPELSELLDTDPTLVTAMEGRQSVRAYGEQPMTVEQLGEFLYRVARVRGTYGPRPEKGMPYAGSSRPYPCGGASYELELYLTVRRCAGLDAGIYFYDPAEHRLHLVNSGEQDRQALLQMGSLSTGGEANPDVLLTMTSRFQRLSWKYQSIAYSVTLKHAGVLYQTMYLVATAMGLAPCGLGSGSSDLASRAFGLDYLRESSVGEFLIGSLPESTPLPVTEGGTEDWRPGRDPQWQATARSLLADPGAPDPGGTAHD